MSNRELTEVFALAIVAFSYIAVPAAVIALLVWVGSRGRRAKARGLAALEEGRLVEAMERFALCDDKLLLMGQAQLWLWRLASATADLEQAVSYSYEKYNERAAPCLALATALRNDPEASRWAHEAAARPGPHSTEGRLAAAVMALRNQTWTEAVQALTPLAFFPTVRARALRDALLAWAQTKLDGQRRNIDAAAVLGEGAIDELEAGFPSLAAVLKAGQTGP